MSISNFQLEIVTPEKSVYNDNVEMLVAPTEEGEIGILTNHAHLVTNLVAGEIRIKKEEATSSFAVSAGFLEATPKKVLILAETVEASHEIDINRAKKARERALQMIEELKKKNEDVSEVLKALERAETRLKVGAGHEN